ncbi:MAG: hypothetical protein ACFHU9_06060 [Fluviicola sp.]
MKNKFENSDKRLQDKLEGFRMAAPEDAWAGIEGNLAGKSNGRGRFFYFWIALLFIGVSSVGIFSFLYYRDHDKSHVAKTSSIASNETNIEQEYTTAKQGNSTTANARNAFENNNRTNKNSFNSDLASESAQNLSNTSSSVGNSQGNGARVNSSNLGNNSSSNATVTSRITENTSNNSSFAQNTTSNNTNASNSNASNSNSSSNYSMHPNNSVLTTAKSNSANNMNLSQTTGEEVNTITEAKNSAPEISESDSTENSDVAVSFQSDTSAVVSSGALDAVRNSEISIQPEEEKARPSWSLEGGLDLSRVNFNHTVSNNDSLQQALNGSYSQNIAQAAFLRFNYQPFERFSFHSGVEFGQQKTTQDYVWTTTSTSFQYDTTGWYFDSITQQQLPIVDTTETTTTVDNTKQLTSTVNQIYVPIGVMIHIPLGVRSELGINATGLVGFQSGSKGEVLLDANGNSIAVTEAYRSVNFSARTTLRYSYFLGSKSTVYIEPYVGFGLNNRSSTTVPFTTRFRNSGIRVGFRYNF